MHYKQLTTFRKLADYSGIREIYQFWMIKFPQCNWHSKSYLLDLEIFIEDCPSRSQAKLKETLEIV
jgi:hypothetical protein